MVKHVEGLRANLQLRTFPLGNPEVLHDGEVRVKEVRTVDLVTALVSVRCDSARSDRRRELCTAEASWIGAVVIEAIRGTARQLPDRGVREKRIAVVESAEQSAGCAVDDREGGTRVREECTRECPVGEQIEPF